MNKEYLSGKNIIVCGATGGIGEACVIALADYGAKVILAGRNKAKLKAVQDKITTNTESHCVAVINFADEDNIDSEVKRIFNEHGEIHGLVYAAGDAILKPLRKTTRDDFRKLAEINAFAAFSFVKSITKLKKNKVGSISFVLISSVMGTLGERCKVSYCASKGAIVSAVKAVSLEIADKGHRINSVSPGIVETDLVKEMMEEFPEDMKQNIYDMHPLGTGKPEDVAEVCSFLLSDKSKWITGTDILIDGGYSAR